MLYETIKNEVIGKLVRARGKYYQEHQPVPLNLDRLQGEVRDTHDLVSLFSLLHKYLYTWDWLSPSLERIFALSRKDLHDFSLAIASNPYFVTSSDCRHCDYEADEC